MATTYKQTTISPESIELKTRDVWENAADTVSHFSDEPLFLESVARLGQDPNDTTTPEYAQALADYAEDYCNVFKDETTEKEQIQIRLLANVPGFLHAQKEISNYDQERKHRRLDNTEWNRYKQYVRKAVKYNQQLSAYALNNPDDSFSDLNQSLFDQALLCFPQDARTIDQSITQATRGARTEAASQKLLDLTGINYTPGTVTDDMRGGDIIIHFNGQRIKVDIKSSLDKIARIRRGYDDIDNKYLFYGILKSPKDRNNSDRVIAIFPGIIDADFEGTLGLRLDEESMQKRALNLAAQLQRAVIELNK
jgi:hypothetical protein